MQKFLHKQRPALYVLAGAFMISFSAIFVKFVDISATSSAFYRVFFGFIFLFFTLVIKKIPFFPPRRHLPLITLCGITFALDLFFWHKSILFIGPGLATLISNFQVFLLAAIGFLFLREKANILFFISIPLALLGLFLIVGTEWQALSSTYKTGIYYGLLTAVCYTVFLLCLRKVQTDKDQSFFSTLTAISLISAFLLAIKMIFASASFQIPNIKTLCSLLALGFFCQTVGWALISNGMPKIKASFTGLILLLQPTLSFIWDVLIFRRPTSLLNWGGVFLTLIAIYLGLSSKKNGN